MGIIQKINPLARGFYTVAEAARLIEDGNYRRIHHWLQGHSEGRPLLKRDYNKVLGRHQELSFLDLIEVRFVEHFRSHGVKMKTLRLAAEKLRQEVKTPHPFATDRIHLEADKADVFLVLLKETAKQTEDRKLVSLTNGNYIIEEMLKKVLVPGLSFDRETSLAKRWVPRHKRFPDIIIDPYVAYGQPTIPGGIPTYSLYLAWQAENKDYDAVAYWNNIKSSEVKRAVDFERYLDKPN